MENKAILFAYEQICIKQSITIFPENATGDNWMSTKQYQEGYPEYERDFYFPKLIRLSKNRWLINNL